MIHNRRNLATAILILFCLTIFVPRLMIGRFEIGLDDTLAFTLLPITIAFIFMNSDSWLLRGNRLYLLLLWITLIFTSIVFSMLASLMYLDQLRIPTEMWQYVKRMEFFCLALYLAYKGKVSSRRFYNVLCYILLAALLIGVIQLVPGGIGEYLSNIYARSEGQMEAMVNRSFSVSRNYGIAGHSIAWGGFAMFSAAVALGGLALTNTRHTLIKLLLLFMAAINVLFSGSRVALSAFFAVVLCFIIVGFFRNKKTKGFFLLKCSVLFSVVALLIYNLFLDKFAFVLFRYRALVEQAGGSRVDQIISALSLLDNWYAVQLGVGNAVQREMAVSFGTESEPVYLLVNYGVLGVALRYGLLFVIFIYACRQLDSLSIDDRILAISAIFALIGYMCFSFGYFFFQELYVGLLPWILFGSVVGNYYRAIRQRYYGINI